MRIISGKFAKRNLYTLKSQKTRPTSDKVKESLFNSLGQFFSGGEVLDLYGGSGALAIEAVSRGCDHAVITDINYAAIEIIRKNVALTREPDRFLVKKMSSNQALKYLAQASKQFDLIFLDPPYAKQQIVHDMAKMLSLDLLADQAIVVAETDDETSLGEVSGFTLTKKHHLGKTLVHFYRKDS
ncbi:16S rRNA (guanine(966)-N(2))-methyltransferase RsmD [Lactobacillus sp. ESL0684]|uniref:16S rRNA (guanine(966)-N(2))-methyltransferase RsmD n=1 Tax=unclassified Lactobacillus TaxID=2620435 RepID=UPI0023F95449|nr:MULTISPECIES: 16S rRNA (guanine(966)-N(2))-methyltransferase RsmD [unclassified Lactobacillus]WEV40612.1 16S rRNA (guanine(966)-N(2))-methyltransferase RsmD [Lactobacillus sp. ESL0681]WEV42868.1 16S rRNA (guanine(966)-N(2))-methyltransferase RsmD [Lactobacillus sp. ESL0684]